MVSALTSFHGRPAGRHTAAKRPGRAKRGRLVGGALAVAVAIAAAAFIVMPAAPASSGGVPHLSSAQMQQLAHATSTQQKAIDHALVASFSRYASTGTGPMPTPGQPSLTAKSWSWGATSNHIWIIMSFTDIHNGALAGITADCGTMFAVAKVTKFAWLCGGLEQMLAHLSNGYSPENNHGVWTALYWWPPKIQYGYW